MPEMGGDNLGATQIYVSIVKRKKRFKQSLGYGEEMAGGPGIEPGFSEPITYPTYL
jgi:hypothetical protein